MVDMIFIVLGICLLLLIVSKIEWNIKKKKNQVCDFWNSMFFWAF